MDGRSSELAAMILTASAVVIMTVIGSTGEAHASGEYFQNGSLGRRITLEVRPYDDGVAFRYVIPKSTPLNEILIVNEDTEFRFAAEAATFAWLLSGFEATPKHQSHIALS
jgi:hypothetical protein